MTNAREKNADMLNDQTRTIITKKKKKNKKGKPQTLTPTFQGSWESGFSLQVIARVASKMP